MKKNFNEMIELEIPEYVERNLCEFLKEYIDMKITFNPQDNELYETRTDEKTGGEIKLEFNEKNINDLYIHDLAEYSNVFTSIGIPLPNSIGKVIKKSFEESKNYYRNMYKEINENKENVLQHHHIFRNFDETLEKRMTENGYLTYTEFRTFSKMKLFKYNVRIQISEIYMDKDDPEKDYKIRLFIHFE